MEGLADREIVSSLELAPLHQLDAGTHVEIDADGGIGIEVATASSTSSPHLLMSLSSTTVTGVEQGSLTIRRL